jgi:GWxTD domain-containing protein
VNRPDLLTITKVEREEFQKLTNGEDRQKFVEKFWERRNPHPGAPLC